MCLKQLSKQTMKTRQIDLLRGQASAGFLSLFHRWDSVCPILSFAVVLSWVHWKLAQRSAWAKFISGVTVWLDQGEAVSSLSWNADVLFDLHSFRN